MLNLNIHQQRTVKELWCIYCQPCTVTHRAAVFVQIWANAPGLLIRAKIRHKANFSVCRGQNRVPPKPMFKSLPLVPWSVTFFAEIVSSDMALLD